MFEKLHCTTDIALQGCYYKSMSVIMEKQGNGFKIKIILDGFSVKWFMSATSMS